MVVRNLEFEMPGDRHFARIDILEIKVHIGKRLGSEKAQKYFGLLDSFFRLKIAKSEFDKLCSVVIGRENVCLHNRLIRSILKNAAFSRTPPRKGNKELNPSSDKVGSGYPRSCVQLRGDVFPPSPRKGRTPGFRDRKFKDRLSPLGPNGKVNAVAASKDLDRKTLEQQSASELLSLGSMPIEVTSVEDGEEVDQAAISPGIESRNHVTPPFGIPWNGKGNRKVLSSLPSSVDAETCLGSGKLPDTSSLRKRLGQKLEKEGMRISVECVNLLNMGLDTYLKRLIKPSLELTSSRFGTMLDFRTAMELNPNVLGEDWPMQLQKVCLRESECFD